MAFYVGDLTEDAHKMREYLASEGVKAPERAGKGKTGNFNYNIVDPDGNIVEIVAYQSDSWTGQKYGKLMPDTGISDHIAHVGALIGPLGASMRFYHDILGFTEFRRGGGSSKRMSWLSMRLPEGQDYLAMMLYNTMPEADKRGTKAYGKEIEVKVG